MLEFLKLYEIPDKIIDTIRVMYIDTTSTVLTTDFSHCNWNTLAPFLFVIVEDYMLRMSVDYLQDKGFQP